MFTALKAIIGLSDVEVAALHHDERRNRPCRRRAVQGWRKVVCFALTENPIADSVIRRRVSDYELTLFSEPE